MGKSVPNNNNETTHTETLIQRAQLAFFIDHQPFSAISTALGMTLLAAVVWGHFPHGQVLVWLGVAYGSSLFRIFIFPLLERQVAPRNLFLANRIAAVAIVLYSGSVWGATAWLFLDIGQTEIFIFVSLIIAGLCAMTLPTHAPYPPAFWIFSSLAMGSLIIQYFLLGYTWIGWLALLYFGGMVGSMGRLRNIVLTSITLDQRSTQLLEEAIAARESAERASRAKSRFLATASHDLRQPLHAIILATNTLKLKHLDPAITEFIRHIETSTDTMMSLFNSILDVSRLDAGVVYSKIVAVDLDAILHDLALRFSPQAEQKGLSLHLEPAAPSSTNATTGHIVMADAVLLERCLSNIICNAIKFTQQGEVRVQVEANEDERLRVVIADTGPGIAEAELTHIFDEFSQVNTGDRAQAQGLGLGLSIVERLAKIINVDVEVASEPGAGTRFSLVIPKAAAGVVPAKPQEEQDVPSLLTGLEVLVIDDDEGVREGMSALLQSWGCRVWTARDTREAKSAAAQAERIDALLVDYGLRYGVTGHDVIRDLYQGDLSHRPPALIITGDTSRASMQALKASGIAYIYKPAKPAKIRNFLQRDCLPNAVATS